MISKDQCHRFVIAGAGGLGREVFHFLTAYAEQILGESGHDWEIRGFLDDNHMALDTFSGFTPVVDSISEYHPVANERVVLAVGIPKIRKLVAEKLMAAGALFFTLPHPTAEIVATATVGQGVLLGPHCTVSDHAVVRDFVIVNSYAVVGHDTVVDDYVELCPKVSVSGNCRIGQEVMVSSHAVIAPGISIGHHAQVSACTAVLRNVRPYSFVQGVPGKESRDFFRKSESGVNQLPAPRSSPISAPHILEPNHLHRQEV